MQKKLEEDRIKNLESCLAEARKIHDQILKIGIESGSNRKELQESIAQQVSIIRLLQSEARLSTNLVSAVTAFSGSVVGAIIMAILKI